MSSANPLKRYRISRQLTQEQIAKKLGCSRQMVGRLETRRNWRLACTADMALLIEKKLGIPREEMRPDYFARAA